MQTKTNGLPKLEAKIRLYQNTSGATGLVAFAELVIDGAFVIKGICIRADKSEPSNVFLSFPARKGSGETKDKYFGIAHPITTEAHQRAKELILGKYREAASANE
jgi:DNA-binding cell septation regulator SpoVG